MEGQKESVSSPTNILFAITENEAKKKKVGRGGFALSKGEGEGMNGSDGTTDQTQTDAESVEGTNTCPGEVRRRDKNEMMTG